MESREATSLELSDYDLRWTPTLVGEPLCAPNAVGLLERFDPRTDRTD